MNAEGNEASALRARLTETTSVISRLVATDVTVSGTLLTAIGALIFLSTASHPFPWRIAFPIMAALPLLVSFAFFQVIIGLAEERTRIESYLYQELGDSYGPFTAKKRRGTGFTKPRANDPFLQNTFLVHRVIWAGSVFTLLAGGAFVVGTDWVSNGPQHSLTYTLEALGYCVVTILMLVVRNLPERHYATASGRPTGDF